MTTFYDALGGAAVLEAVAHAWHERMLADPVTRHPFDHGYRSDHTERLAAYWAEALGGPPTYSTSMGTESDVVRLHSGNGPHEDLDARAVGCFAGALRDAGVPEELHERLVAWFRDANTAVNHRYERPEDVPDGLRLPVAQNS